ncbi:DoxX protein [Arcobacter sp. HD9-500m-PIT-SAG03]|mgnify:FL=1|nr:DoxX protein [Arcobacter sp. HD9-500m-PIT-SAG03]
MKEKIFIGIQVITGLLLVMFGSNTFLQFMPMPEMTPIMGEFMGALYKTGYIFPISAIIEILAGISFLSNKFTSLMAVLVMPVMLNALLSHLFLDPLGIGAAAFIVFAIIIVMIRNKECYNEIFKA